jgi:hypothetical protein
VIFTLFCGPNPSPSPLRQATIRDHSQNSRQTFPARKTPLFFVKASVLSRAAKAQLIACRRVA